MIILKKLLNIFKKKEKNQDTEVQKVEITLQDKILLLKNSYTPSGSYLRKGLIYTAIYNEQGKLLYLIDIEGRVKRHYKAKGVPINDLI